MSQYTWEFQQLNTVNYGFADALHDILVILNLGCPDSRSWYLENEDDLFEKVASHDSRLHLKFWNKPVDNLVNGGIADQYIDYRHPEDVRSLIHNIFTDQEHLNALTEAKVASYLEKAYDLSQPSNLASKLTANEVAAAGITVLPSIIIDDQLQAEQTSVLANL